MTPLRQRMINDMTVRGLASSTLASYLRSVTRLARHYGRSPNRISACEVQDYLLFLHQEHGLSWQTCNTVRHGVRFFFRITLGRPDPHFYVPGAKVPSTLPQILNHEELVRLFTVTTNLRISVQYSVTPDSIRRPESAGEFVPVILDPGLPLRSIRGDKRIRWLWIAGRPARRMPPRHTETAHRS